MSRLRRLNTAVVGLAVGSVSVTRKLAAAVDTAPGIFLSGWSMVVAGLALRSISLALVCGGSLLIGVVIVGARKA